MLGTGFVMPGFRVRSLASVDIRYGPDMRRAPALALVGLLLVGCAAPSGPERDEATFVERVAPNYPPGTDVVALGDIVCDGLREQDDKTSAWETLGMQLLTDGGEHGLDTAVAAVTYLCPDHLDDAGIDPDYLYDRERDES